MRTRGIDFTGMVLGKLTVLHKAGKAKNGETLWAVRCACSPEKSTEKCITSGALTIQRSCGCSKVKHGATRHYARPSEYRAWAAMLDRCRRSANPAYPDYGGRGITVCDDWLNSFESFIAYIGAKPGPEYSIDRINNDGNYEPGNVRWATRLEQMNNIRSNHWLTFQGKTMTVADWVRESGIPGPTLRRRLAKGWPLEEVFSRWATPDRKRRKSRFRWVTLGDKTLTLAEWSRETGIPHRTISDRLDCGWSVERALSK